MRYVQGAGRYDDYGIIDSITGEIMHESKYGVGFDGLIELMNKTYEIGRGMIQTLVKRPWTVTDDYGQVWIQVDSEKYAKEQVESYNEIYEGNKQGFRISNEIELKEYPKAVIVHTKEMKVQ